MNSRGVEEIGLIKASVFWRPFFTSLTFTHGYKLIAGERRTPLNMALTMPPRNPIQVKLENSLSSDSLEPMTSLHLKDQISFLFCMYFHLTDRRLEYSVCSIALLAAIHWRMEHSNCLPILSVSVLSACVTGMTVYVFVYMWPDTYVFLCVKIFM